MRRERCRSFGQSVKPVTSNPVILLLRQGAWAAELFFCFFFEYQIHQNATPIEATTLNFASYCVAHLPGRIYANNRGIRINGTELWSEFIASYEIERVIRLFDLQIM